MLEPYAIVSLYGLEGFVGFQMIIRSMLANSSYHYGMGYLKQTSTRYSELLRPKP